MNKNNEGIYRKLKYKRSQRDRSKKLKGKSKKIPEELLFTLNFYLFT